MAPRRRTREAVAVAGKGGGRGRNDGDENNQTITIDLEETVDDCSDIEDGDSSGDSTVVIEIEDHEGDVEHELDTQELMYKAMCDLAPESRMDDPVFVWVLANKSDEDGALTAYRPSTFAGRPCFEVAYSKVVEYFKPGANKSGAKPIPEGMQIGKAAHKGSALSPGGSGKWQCIKLYSVKKDYETDDDGSDSDY